MAPFFQRCIQICGHQCGHQWKSMIKPSRYCWSKLSIESYRSFGKYAKYEKQAHARLQFQKRFYGWRKWVVIAYNIGFFKMIKWGIITYLVYKYWNYCWPLIKYGAIITSTVFIGLYWLRFAVWRRFGEATYEKRKFKLCSTRFEKVFKEYDQLSTGSLIWMIHKTWFKTTIFRNHRKWIKSLQNFLDNYKPFKYYTGDEMKHGIAFQPLLMEYDGYYKGDFTWFIDRNDTLNTYGWVEIKCDGNYYARTMNVNEFRLHVNPREGGEVLKFDPFKLSIDDKWNAQLLQTLYNFGDKDGEKKVSKEMPRQKLHSKRRHKKASNNKIEEAEYSMKK